MDDLGLSNGNFANDLAHLQDIASRLQVEVDDLVITVNLGGADLVACEVEDFQCQTLGTADTHLSAFHRDLDILELGVGLGHDSCGRIGFELGIQGGFLCAGRHCCYDGKKCQKKYVFLHLEAYFIV